MLLQSLSYNRIGQKNTNAFRAWFCIGSDTSLSTVRCVKNISVFDSSFISSSSLPICWDQASSF